MKPTGLQRMLCSWSISALPGKNNMIVSRPPAQLSSLAVIHKIARSIRSMTSIRQCKTLGNMEEMEDLGHEGDKRMNQAR